MAAVSDVSLIGRRTTLKDNEVPSLAGGSQQVRLLREALHEYKNDDNLIVLFFDSYDVIVNADAEEILNRFYKHEAKVLFSADGNCWPDSTLAMKYPIVKFGKRYLNSGAFVGYAPEVYKMITHQPIDDGENDQLFYTMLYLDDHLREELNIKLDSTSEIFQNLKGAVEDVSIDLSLPDKGPQLANNAYGTLPVIVHAAGSSRIHLNNFGNYLANWWNPKDGCVACHENTILLEQEDQQKWPTVQLSIFFVRAAPFIEFFFEYLMKLNYPKSRISLFIYNKKRCDYLFSVDSEVHLDNPETLHLLIEANSNNLTRSFIAPLVVRLGKLWSNFWGAVTQDGFYARSFDYTAILNERRGLWNVPYVTNIYLIKSSRLAELKDAYSYAVAQDADMSFCQFCRDSGYFMFVDSQHYYGHLLDPEDFDTSVIHPDLYNIFQNKFDWERKYLHENYSNVLKPHYNFTLPCPDVYWFPLFSREFCRHLIDIMENFGKWSGGKNQDERLAGGYENVPTRDIHLNQVGFERQWLYILDTYVRPVQELVYLGYSKQPPRAIMNFVVRYHPDEQASLRPHHDASTYTTSTALNQVGSDYEGGGVRYVRYNCSIVDIEPGWTVLQPGRLTHYHEGLPTKKGIRYILVSFVDP
ncbi:unnamed protein product [Soboliphyme baturini]|uniref:Fe2OG dioxygenase domain-containing protein n=1 Tax=Soboliphyme baturini TaxID=241478 RepID=A0A183ISV3_9BILA|nr:unnamed protein product [Soboliphyme baturini]